MQVENEKKTFAASKMPNVTLFLIMAGVFTLLGYANRARLSANFGIEGLDVIINIAILFAIMIAVGGTYIVNLSKKRP